MKRTFLRNDAIVRFAGDSGDGIQIIGSQFAATSSRAGNDVRTMPDFPSEIRAPEGTIGGVSSFQVHFSSHEVYSSGDACDVLVVMNAAALKTALPRLRKGGMIIAHTQGFSEKYLRLAGYASNPLEAPELQAYYCVQIDMVRHTALALQKIKERIKLSTKETERAKNFFALGLVCWLFSRPMDTTKQWIAEKFASQPHLVEVNTCVLEAGWNFAESTEVLPERFSVEASQLPKGRYRSLTGNVAIALGLVASALKARLPLFFGAYPITPASDILHTLVHYKRFGVHVFQAEDEIAAIAAALGASFGGSLAATATSGPGMSLKTEALGLAVMAELPLVVVNVQRAGPSTGMPTKTEQADLLQALFGRHGEAPLPVLAPQSPADCFTIAVEAARIALKYRTPVIVLSDAMLANGSEPWKIPGSDAELPEISAHFASNPFEFSPYLRDEITFARDWAIPGTKGLEHRIGGLEKDKNTGAVSQDPANHAEMVKIRAQKIAGIASEIPPSEYEVAGDQEGDVLLLSWGSTFGVLREALERLQAHGVSCAHLHIRYINPLPRHVPTIMASYQHIVVPELNHGQFAFVLQGISARAVKSFSKMQGQAFTAEEIVAYVQEMLSQKQAAAIT